MPVAGSQFRDSHLGFSISFAATAIPGKEGRNGWKVTFFQMIHISYFIKTATYFFNPKLQRQMLNLTALLITLFTGEVEGAKMRAWTELECEEEGRYKVIWLKKQFEAKLIKCKTRTCKTPIQSWNDSDSTFLPEWMRTRVLDLTDWIQSTDFLCSKFCC